MRKAQNLTHISHSLFCTILSNPEDPENLSDANASKKLMIFWILSPNFYKNALEAKMGHFKKSRFLKKGVVFFGSWGRFRKIKAFFALFGVVFLGQKCIRGH